jgi:hypothetical protein
MLLVCGVLIWRHFAGMPWMLEAAEVVGLLAVLMASKQLHAMHKFRKVQAELDSERGSTGMASLQRANQDRSTSIAEDAAAAESERTDTQVATDETAAS